MHEVGRILHTNFELHYVYVVYDKQFCIRIRIQFLRRDQLVYLWYRHTVVTAPLNHPCEFEHVEERR